MTGSDFGNNNATGLLSVRNLRKSFRSKTNLKVQEVLKGVSFDLRPGRVTGFLGSNGAGKTTTIKCLLGLIFPDAGEIDFFAKGYNSEEIKKRIGFLPERPYFYDYLTGEEYLEFCGQLSGVLSASEIKRRMDELFELVELSHARTKALREYSKGMLQRVGIAQALIHNPELVILDEPMSGLDPDGRFKVNEILRETARRGTSVFFSSHLLNDAELLCQDLVILAKGAVVYTGAMEDLLKRLQVGYLISYRERELVRTVTVATEDFLQKQVDDLRSKGHHILEVKADRPSLEKAFVQIQGQVQGQSQGNI